VVARSSVARGKIAVHGGAVERDGRVLLIAGPSGAGKSTLTAALVRGGARYVTDEVAVADLATGELFPYPKPFDLTVGSWRLLGLDAAGDEANGAPGDRRKNLLPVEALGKSSHGGAAVALLVLDPSTSPARRVYAVEEKIAGLLANVFAEQFQRRHDTQRAPGHGGLDRLAHRRPCRSREARRHRRACRGPTRPRWRRSRADRFVTFSTPLKRCLDSRMRQSMMCGLLAATEQRRPLVGGIGADRLQ
jgi:hypothetical protein